MKIMETGITDIAYVLESLGVDVRRAGEREISGCCPVHLRRTGKVDRSPSWSMNSSTGLWICYSCGAKGTLSSLVSELTGTEQSIIEVHKFLIESGLKRLTQTEKPEEQPEVDWVSYSQFEDVDPLRLQKRQLDPKSARMYGIKWDPKNKCWVIPIVSPLGELLGWQSKKTGWVRNFPIGVKKSETLFGIERFNTKVAVLVESPLDVVRLASADYGVQGLATFGAHVSKTQLNILSNFATKVIVAMDNDDAGIDSSLRLFGSMPRFKDGVLWLNYKHTKAKDIGDMTNDEIEEALSTAQPIPGWLL